MSKTYKNHETRFNDEYDDYYNNPIKSYVEKKKSKRIARALKTKDVNALLESEDYDFEDFKPRR